MIHGFDDSTKEKIEVYSKNQIDSFIRTESKTMSLIGMDLEPNSNKDFEVSVEKEGYTPVGVVGIKINDLGLAAAPNVIVRHAYINGTTLNFQLRNTGSVTSQQIAIYFYILYKKL